MSSTSMPPLGAVASASSTFIARVAKCEASRKRKYSVSSDEGDEKSAWAPRFDARQKVSGTFFNVPPTCSGTRKRMGSEGGEVEEGNASHRMRYNAYGTLDGTLDSTLDSGTSDSVSDGYDGASERTSNSGSALSRPRTPLPIPSPVPPTPTDVLPPMALHNASGIFRSASAPGSLAPPVFVPGTLAIAWRPSHVRFLCMRDLGSILDGM